MDRSFQGLLISVVVHVFAFVLLLNAKFTHAPQQERPTEITLVEPESDHNFSNKARDLTPKKFNDESKLKTFVSRRAKEQTVSRNATTEGKDAVTLPHPNFAPQFNPQPPPDPKKPREQGVGEQEEPREEKPLREYQPVRSTPIGGAQSMAEFIPGIKAGSITAYSSDQFTYFAFFSRLNDAVGYRWVSEVRQVPPHMSEHQKQMLNGQTRVTVVQMVLTPAGKIHDLFVQSTSGVLELDQAALDSLRSSAPFHNPPAGMIEKDGLIHIPCSFEVIFGPPGFG